MSLKVSRPSAAVSLLSRAVGAGAGRLWLLERLHAHDGCYCQKCQGQYAMLMQRQERKKEKTWEKLLISKAPPMYHQSNLTRLPSVITLRERTTAETIPHGPVHLENRVCVCVWFSGWGELFEVLNSGFTVCPGAVFLKRSLLWFYLTFYLRWHTLVLCTDTHRHKKFYTRFYNFTDLSACLSICCMIYYLFICFQIYPFIHSFFHYLFS